MTEFTDPQRRLADMADSFEPRIKRRFLEVLGAVRDQVSLETLEVLIAQGRIEDALLVAETAALGLSNALAAQWNQLFVQAGAASAQFLSQVLQVVIDFDQVNERAVAAMQANKLELVREIVQEQRLSTQQIILDGVRAGLNPKEVARSVRDGLGLTQHQAAAVSNYRRLLQQGSSEALRRELRDARFDRTVRRAREEPLSPEQIDRMVRRYEQRFIDYRARVIARTEATQVANQGNHELYIQAVDGGQLAESDIERKWDAGRDGRTRDSHVFMQGQRRGLRERFLSGDGNHPLYPGDPSLPGSDRIQCRCALATRLKVLAVEGSTG